MKISFIVKGLIKNKNLLLTEVKNHFPQAEILETKHPFHAVELAKYSAENNFTHVVAVGGDGTISEVVNGLASTRNQNLPVLGLLSHGTANDFSKTAKLDGSMAQLKSLIEKKSTKRIDIGHIQFTGKDMKPAERYFLNIGDIGIGGQIVENINKSKKTFGPDMTFFLETFKAMFSYKRTKVKCVAEGFQWEGKTLSMIVANGKYFGSGLCIAPDASLSDGKLNVVILGDVTVIDYLRNLAKVKRGEKIIDKEVFYREAGEVSIHPIESQCPIDLDGEFIGYAPATFRCIPGRIDFLMP